MINKLEEIKTVENRAIELWNAHSEKSDKTVLLIGVFHGDEFQGEFLIRKFLETVKSEDLKNNILAIPCFNPDGKHYVTRQNANGIDLNRNFPTKDFSVVPKDENYYGGETPASEIETRFMTDIIDKYKPDFILTIHSPYRVVNYDGPALEEAKKISEITGYPVEENIGYETPGSFGTYAGKERNIPIITLELPDGDSYEKLWEDNNKVFNYLAFEY